VHLFYSHNKTETDFGYTLPLIKLQHPKRVLYYVPFSSSAITAGIQQSHLHMSEQSADLLKSISSTDVYRLMQTLPNTAVSQFNWNLKSTDACICTVKRKPWIPYPFINDGSSFCETGLHRPINHNWTSRQGRYINQNFTIMTAFAEIHTTVLAMWLISCRFQPTMGCTVL